LSGESVLLEGSHEGALLVVGLETTMTELGGSVDPFQVDLLESGSLCVRDEGLAEGENSLLGSDAAALEHDKVVLDFTVVGETTHWSDRFVSEIGLSGSVVFDEFTTVLVDSFTDSVDLLVDLGTMMVTLLTGSGNRVGYSGWMPCTNASDLPQTFVGLARKLLGVPTGGDTFFSLSFVDTNDVDHFILGEDCVNVDWLLEEGASVVDLIADGATVDLDFHDVGLLGSQWKKLHLGVSDDTDDLAVFLHLLEISFNLLLAIFILPFAAGLAESLLLSFVPVLVESSLAFFADVFGKDGLESTESTWSFNVSDSTNHNHGWGLQNSDSIDNLLLVGF